MNACMVGWKSCIHSHQSTTSLTQTGTTTDTYGLIWHIHVTSLLLVLFFLTCKIKWHDGGQQILIKTCLLLLFLFFFFLNLICICQIKMLKKVTVKGSHGNNSWQRESDSSGVKRTVSWQGSAVQSAPQGPKQNTWAPEGFTHKNQTDYTRSNTDNNVIQTPLGRGGGPRAREGKRMQLSATEWPITVKNTASAKRSQ